VPSSALTDVGRRLAHRRPDLIREALIGALIWLVPAAVLVVVLYLPSHYVSPNRAVAYLAAFLIVAFAASRPAASLLALVALLPFQGFVLAKMWQSGVPTSVVKDLGSWKEALAIGVILAGARGWFASGKRADTVDRLALAFVALTAVYFALGPKIVSSAPAGTSIRALGFRETAGFALLLLGARHAPLGPDFPRRATRIVLIAGTVIAAAGIYEAIASNAWNRFVVGTIQYTKYQVGVLHTHPPNMWNILSYGQIAGSQVVRIGSVFLNPLTAGFYLLIGFAVGLERTIRRASFATGLGPTLVIGAGLILTETRSAIIGALLVTFLAFQPSAGRRSHFRTQVALVLGVLALIVVPAAVASGALTRFSLLSDSSNTSTKGHESGFSHGLATLVHHPLGQGLGTGAGTGQRFGVAGTTIPEDNYLEVGDELGWLPFLVFVALTVALILGLRRVARVRDDPLLTASWAAAAGLAVTALFLQTWADFSVSWTFWGLAGAMLGVAARTPATSRRAHRAAPVPVPAPSARVAEHA
jgi:hypothetical protein